VSEIPAKASPLRGHLKLALTYFAYGDGTPFAEIAQGLATVSQTVSPPEGVPSVLAGLAFE